MTSSIVTNNPVFPAESKDETILRLSKKIKDLKSEMDGMVARSRIDAIEAEKQTVIEKLKSVQIAAHVEIDRLNLEVAQLRYQIKCLTEGTRTE